MQTRRVLPYLAALILLAWVLGSLSLAGTGGTSILSNSYWLVYLVSLIPVLALIATAAMIVFLIVNWRDLSDSIGWGMAQRRRMKRQKTPRKLQAIVWLGFWGLALGVLFWKCGSIPCRASNSTETLPETVEFIVENTTQSLPLLPALTATGAALDFVGSGWFGILFFALLIVSSVILARGVKVSMDELRSDSVLPLAVREEGRMAVEDALEVLRAEEAGDPRERIIACYERMIRAAAGLGANVSVDQTARELEKGIRRTFQLEGEGIADLTHLFEEARYSLHPITEEDSSRAKTCLLEIGEELKAGIVD